MVLKYARPADRLIATYSGRKCCSTNSTRLIGEFVDETGSSDFRIFFPVFYPPAQRVLAVTYILLGLNSLGLKQRWNRIVTRQVKQSCKPFLFNRLLIQKCFSREAKKEQICSIVLEANHRRVAVDSAVRICHMRVQFIALEQMKDPSVTK